MTSWPLDSSGRRVSGTWTISHGKPTPASSGGQQRALEAIQFFPDVLCLPDRSGGDVTPETGEPKPFVLEPWQQFVVGSMFGWFTTPGFRRFREAYIETAKGSGKTPLGAGMMLYLLVADGERGAQIFLAAVKREQADVAWRDVLAMVDASPCLRDALDRKANNLALLEDGSFLRPVSSETRGLDGKRVHGALVDELHEHPNGDRREQDPRRHEESPERHDRQDDEQRVRSDVGLLAASRVLSRKVLEGTITNESWFAFVCGLDPCQTCVDAGRWFPSDECSACDQWRIEGDHWKKANPNLGVSLPWQYVRERVEQARGMPSEVSDVLRFNFCVWTQSTSRAIDLGRWAACKPMPAASELVGVPCYGGLDLGESDDF